jgi:iduronate 2-sulfatase
MYPDASTFKIAKYQTRQKDQPLIAFHSAGFALLNGTSYQGSPDKPLPISVQQIFRKAYYTAVTQTDHYVGMVLNELDDLGLTDSTIVVLHSDHGWQLGERGVYDKQTNFEPATRVPLIIKVPWKSNSHGQHTGAFAELIDLHPTLSSLAGLPYTPPTPNLPSEVEAQGTGQDLSPLFDNPNAKNAHPGKNASYSEWPVCTTFANMSCMACTGPLSSRAVLDSMGYSIRTLDWRLTVWVPFNNTLYTANWDKDPIAVELYDHRNASIFDFDNDGEIINLAGDPDYADIQATLMRQLQEKYTWPSQWLLGARNSMLTGQLSDDKKMGFFPYSGLPQPSSFSDEL